MSGAKKRARRHRRPWSELPQDLLSVILDRLAPAFGDRVRFRGVCQAWRAAEIAHPRPHMPWLVGLGRCVSLQTASIRRVPLPEDAAAAICRGSLGDWLALVSSPTGRPFLLNAFTMERIKLPRWKKKKPMVKFALSSAPDSESCMVAAIVDDEDDGEDYTMTSKIVVCRVGRGGSWQTMTRTFELQDIMFFEGKLHALDGKARVHVFQDDDLQRAKLWKPPQYKGRPLYLDGARMYLLVLHERLHMVGRAFGRKHVPGCANFTCAVGVFAFGVERPELIKDFGGNAVFVGDACCDALPIDGSSSGGYKIRENQICFVDDEKDVSPLVLAGYSRRRFRQLLSYDVRTDCLRTYQPTEPGTWQCVMAQRIPHSPGMRPPPREPMPGQEKELLDMPYATDHTRGRTQTRTGEIIATHS